MASVDVQKHDDWESDDERVTGRRLAEDEKAPGPGARSPQAQTEGTTNRLLAGRNDSTFLKKTQSLGGAQGEK